ncbi:peroxiredoxin [Rhodopseudomonas sp. B29]|uniref:peroxiredoxin n=1 Tax=Rhodopseudomonas sp. B29 TaxID=95607 RepID=UPI00034BA4C8|nr:peroxiredoxin [Rhodopseudomonas sp. B29]
MSKQTREKSSKSKAAAKAGNKLPARPAKPSAAAAPANKPAAGKVAAAKPMPKPAKKAATAPAKPAKAAKKPSPPAAAPALAEGARAPDFALARDGGEILKLADCSGQKLVIFFYPRANTPGCTREAIDFSRLKKDFAACGTRVIGVSADSVKAQDSFRDKHQLTTPLLSDPTHAMLEAYGAWGEKSLYGRKFEGILRTTVLIGSDGHIAKVWRNVKVDGHAEQVLAAAREL